MLEVCMALVRVCLLLGKLNTKVENSGVKSGNLVDVLANHLIR